MKKNIIITMEITTWLLRPLIFSTLLMPAAMTPVLLKISTTPPMIITANIMAAVAARPWGTVKAIWNRLTGVRSTL